MAKKAAPKRTKGISVEDLVSGYAKQQAEFDSLSLAKLKAAYRKDWPGEKQRAWSIAMMQREEPLEERHREYLVGEPMAMGQMLRHPLYTGVTYPTAAALVNWQIEM